MQGLIPVTDLDGHDLQSVSLRRMFLISCCFTTVTRASNALGAAESAYTLDHHMVCNIGGKFSRFNSQTALFSCTASRSALLTTAHTRPSPSPSATTREGSYHRKASMENEDYSAADYPVGRGFHNPLFNTNAVAPKDSRLFPAAEEELSRPSQVSSLVMRRHGQRDGRRDGTTFDITRRRTDEQERRHKQAASEKRMKLVSSVELPACVVVRDASASDTGEVLQHCAFRMETFRVYGRAAPDDISFMFVFNSGEPSQAMLSITHIKRPTSTGGMRSSDGVEGRIKMTLSGLSVPHVAGEPLSCHIRQVGTVTFNPRKQAKGSYLYILSQEGRTLFTSLS